MRVTRFDTYNKHTYEFSRALRQPNANPTDRSVWSDPLRTLLLNFGIEHARRGIGLLPHLGYPRGTQARRAQRGVTLDVLGHAVIRELQLGRLMLNGDPRGCDLAVTDL